MASLSRRVFKLLLLLCTWEVGATEPCEALFSGDKFLQRLDHRLHESLDVENPDFYSARENIEGAFVANEFDRGRPLSIVLFSNSTEALKAMSSAVASSIFGEKPPKHSVSTIDFQQLLSDDSEASVSSTRIHLRSSLALQLFECPSRSLHVFENVQVVSDASLPILDTFLDPLNGKRAQFYHESTSFDCTNAIFLFLFHTNTRPDPSWRDFLLHHWTREQFDGDTDDAFTPQALVGRLSEGVSFFGNVSKETEPYTDSILSGEWRFLLEEKPKARKEVGLFVFVGLVFGCAAGLWTEDQSDADAKKPKPKANRKRGKTGKKSSQKKRRRA